MTPDPETLPERCSPAVIGGTVFDLRPQWANMAGYAGRRLALLGGP